MKILIPVLVFLFVLSGCSEWKYGRGIRPSKNEVRYSEVIIEKNKVEPLVIDVPRVTNNDLALSEKTTFKSKSVESKSVESKSVESKTKFDKKELEEINWIPTQDRVVENLDSLKRQQEIIDQAKRAERSGKNSLILGILSTLFSFTPLFIAGFILGIKGLSKSSSALDAPYITPKGLNSARVGYVFSLVGVVVSSIFIFFLLLILLLFIFAL
ncbi:MAG: hypothetical protein PHQ74_12300 [Crocinitomicaceae bacterium]|nr:hypothetical protein [Crocinitomicaceae bacterium]